MPSRSPRRTYLALLAAALTLSARADVQLLPAGEFKARDGRPGPGKTWKIDDPTGRRMAAELTAQSARTEFLFDYDHQTIRSEANGVIAPAAGWARTFAWRPGQGLYATGVSWTEAALASIELGEYRYVSPVITFDDQGCVTGVLMAAITNYPALLGMEQLGQSLAAQLSAQFTTPTTPNTPEHDVTLLEQLIAALGLKAGTTDAEALSAVIALRTAAGKPAALSGAITGALSLAATADEATALAAIQTLKTQATGADATTATTIAALQGQLATLMAQTAEREVNEVVQAALSAGKLLPAQKEWATSVGKKDLGLLKLYVAGAPTMASLQSQTGGKAPEGAGGAAALTTEAREALALMGVTEDAWTKQFGTKA
jgi:phage I-like protein